MSGRASTATSKSELGSVGSVADKDTDKGTEVPTTDADVVTGINSLSIATNAKGGAKSSTKTVTSARSNTSAVKEVSPHPSSQVNSDVANPLKSHVTGVKPKIKPGAYDHVNLRSSNSVGNARPNPRLDLNQRVHITRFSHCELCNQRDNGAMVQCDGCNKWYHFSCVEVTSGVVDQSWVCPKCPFLHFGASNKVEKSQTLHQVQPVDPPPNLNSRKSSGKASSSRSNQRKVDRKLQKLEELKQLERKFLESTFQSFPINGRLLEKQRQWIL